MFFEPDSLGGSPRSFARESALVESRRTWWKRTTRCVLSSLVVCSGAPLLGCGGDTSSPVIPEDIKQKQQVVQDKMKEYMQQKGKTKGTKR